MKMEFLEKSESAIGRDFFVSSRTSLPKNVYNGDTP